MDCDEDHPIQPPPHANLGYEVEANEELHAGHAEPLNSTDVPPLTEPLHDEYYQTMSPKFDEVVDQIIHGQTRNVSFCEVLGMTCACMRRGLAAVLYARVIVRVQSHVERIRLDVLRSRTASHTIRHFVSVTSDLIRAHRKIGSLFRWVDNQFASSRTLSVILLEQLRDIVLSCHEVQHRLLCAVSGATLTDSGEDIDLFFKLVHYIQPGLWESLEPPAHRLQKPQFPLEADGALARDILQPMVRGVKRATLDDDIDDALSRKRTLEF